MSRHNLPREETKRVKKKINYAKQLRKNKIARITKTLHGENTTKIKLPEEVDTIPVHTKSRMAGKVNANDRINNRHHINSSTINTRSY